MKYRHSTHRSKGYSLVEILIVLVIIALLTSVSLPCYGYLRRKAALVACVGNLRVIGTGLHGYMIDNNMTWPQCPFETFERFEQESEWWEQALKPYDVALKHWLCPADDDQKTKKSPRGEDGFESSYSVTPFDEFPQTAYRWKQPWVIERSNNHLEKEGPNMLMPDGTIQQGIPLPTIPR